MDKVPLLHVALIVAACGAFGGFINAVTITYRGLPRGTEGAVSGPEISQGPTKWFWDFPFNIFIGAVAAFVSWALYGPYRLENVLVGQPLTQAATEFNITWEAVGAAIIIGTTGTRWLRTEADKKKYQRAAGIAARKRSDNALANLLESASPEQAINLAYNAPEGE